MKKKLFFSMVALLVSFSLSAVDIYVNPVTGNDANNGTLAAPMKTIESAVFAVKDNVETNIHIADNSIIKLGAVLNFGENKKVNISGRNVTIKAHDLPAQKDPSGLPVTGEGNRILRATANCNMKISGITFQNGRQVGYILGGAIFFAGNTLEIDCCKFIDNQAGSSGGAIAGRAKSIIVKNSYFEGNNILGGGARGAAIMQCGPSTGDPGTLSVQNCTFYQNTTQSGGSGVAINIFDSSDANIGGNYSNMGKVEVINSVFFENTSNASISAYQAAIDVSSGEYCKVVLVNNTFYKNTDGALRLMYNTAYLANNVIVGGKQGILSDISVVEGRPEITAVNNIIVGTEGGINSSIDEACLTTAAAANNNIVNTIAAYPLSTIGLATSLTTADNFVPYLEITSSSSTLINAGVESTLAAFGTNYVLPTDIRGFYVKGTKDIGAYEYDGIAPDPNAINSPEYISENYRITRSDNTISIIHLSDKSFSVKVVDMIGKVVYSTQANSSVEVLKNTIGNGIFIIVLNDGNISSKKVLF